MPAPEMHRRSKNNVPASQSKAGFDVPKAVVARATFGLASLAVLLTGTAWLVQGLLVDRQLAGVRRVIQSLDAEASILNEQWRSGALPAETLQAEEQHIGDELEQQKAQFSQLEEALGSG
jgi:hypothetical protein